jgi:hypothetical protein
MPAAKAVEGKALLSPTDHTLILVDFQPQIVYAAGEFAPFDEV